LGVSTDLWNDIPYTEAFQGDANLTPAFNTQQEIYATIQQLLTDAIANLQIVGNYEAIDGDMMYGGDLASWVKAAYALKARYALHLSKIQPQTAYADALAALPNGFASNDEDLTFVFGTADADANPLWQFMNERGDISMNSYFIDMLLLRQDPRITVYAYPDAAGGYSGNGPGGTNADASAPGPAVASKNSPVPFISYAECLFIKAECEFVTQAPMAQVKQTLVDGLTASLNSRGVFSQEYITGYQAMFLDTVVTPGVLFNEIMTQKYIALYYQAEPYNDWRRTGLPLITPNVPSLEIPRRYPYPTEEISYNPNTPAYGNIWNRVWWDTP
ncbi:MAG: SusD/RagB family nutrient-binding outer membrane lipoprotein, partial [Bacteroidota bacterium]